jgi:hypothetical protein
MATCSCSVHSYINEAYKESNNCSNASHMLAIPFLALGNFLLNDSPVCCVLHLFLTAQNVLTKPNRPPLPPVDVEVVNVYETQHRGGPVLGLVQMDWAVPFSSTWNKAAIHALAQGFWDCYKGKVFDKSEITIDKIKALCVCKLECTCKEYASKSDAMDTDERALVKKSREAADRRYSRKIGVRSSFLVGG